ncbi:MAG: DUF4412 domain-containing protein [Chitinophagaceae bacterium]
MKKILLFACLLGSLTSFTQAFEGTITWAIKTDLTDPTQKASMEKLQQQMNDPAKQDEMKKMQERMNSPEMKTMMEKNPQMKAQMENMMKMMQGGGLTSLLPKSFTLKAKGNNTLTKMDGGVAPMEILFLQDKGTSYMLDRKAKTYSVLPASTTGGSRDSLRAKVTKTGETMKVLNYNCTKYIVALSTTKGTLNQIFWTTTEIKGLDMKRFTKQNTGNNGQAMYYDGLAGIALRIEMVTAQMNMVMEVSEIKRETLPAADFSIPADFKETKNPYVK